MPKFNFANVQEIDFSVLLTPGIYKATLHEYEEYESAAGNETHRFVWHIVDTEDIVRKVWDYITVPTGMFKMRQVCLALGGVEDASGDLDIDFNACLNRQVSVKLGIQKGKGINPSTGEPYADRNIIQTYLEPIRDKFDEEDLTGLFA